MTPTIGYQLTDPGVRALAANANTSAFTAKTAATTTRPSGNLVYDLGGILGAGGGFRARCKLTPFGAGSANDTFSLRVYGWSRVVSADKPDLYWPQILLEIACTLGAMTGVAGGPVLDTELFVDTITVVTEEKVGTVGQTTVMSPANDTPAFAEFRLHGAELLEFDFDQTLNSPTMNALLQFLGGEK